MIGIKQEQAELGAALLKGRCLTNFPDDLPGFGAVVTTENGDVGEIVAWLGPQIAGPGEDDLHYGVATAMSNQRFAVIYVLAEKVGNEFRHTWPTPRFSYAPETTVSYVGPQQQRPGFAVYLAVAILGSTLEGMDAQLLEGLGLEPPQIN